VIVAPPRRLVDLDKPRMRGWLHAYAFFVAVACGTVLISVAAARPGLVPTLSCAIYAVTTCGLFGVSALYHRRVWTPRGYAVMRRLDHAMIFIFIAGTYTPFCLLLLPSGAAALLLAVVWTGAIAGAALKLVWPHAPRWLSAPLYLGLGWVAVVVLPDIGRAGGVTALVLLMVGGVAYSVGAFFYALRRPNPWPTVFGYHEFFHACTLVAAICHHIAVYFALFG
jgi:hemolysin III